MNPLIFCKILNFVYNWLFIRRLINDASALIGLSQYTGFGRVLRILAESVRYQRSYMLWSRPFILKST